MVLEENEKNKLDRKRDKCGSVNTRKRKEKLKNMSTIENRRGNMLGNLMFFVKNITRGRSKVGEI